MWRSQIPASKTAQKPVQKSDDDWETDPDFVNNVSEKEQRYGSKTVAGSGVVGSQDLTELRQAVVQTDAEKKKQTYDQTARPIGYGGTYGVETDRMDKSAVGNDYKAQVEKHASQKDYSQGFGGKYGVQADRQDKSAETYAYRANVEKHASQQDYSRGFGGKYGVEHDRKDAAAEGYDYRAQTEKHGSQKEYKEGYGGAFGVQQDRQDKSAVGWDHKEKTEKHSSQKDYSKGFGGKFGVESDRQDRSAVGWERKPEDAPKPQPRPVVVPAGENSGEQSESATSIKAKFETMSKGAPPIAPTARPNPGKLNMRWQKPAEEPPAEEPPKPANGHKAEDLPQEQRQSNGHAVTAEPEPPAVEPQPEPVSDNHRVESQHSPLFAEEEIPPEPVPVQSEQQQVEDLGQRFAEETTLAEETKPQEFDNPPPLPTEQQYETSKQQEEAPHDSNNLTATVQFDYETSAPDELPLVTGAIVTNIQMVDEGWWYGTSNGATGLFPANYVELNQ